MRLRGDSVAGALTAVGELQAPTLCGTLTLTAERPAPDALRLVLVRRPPGPEYDCSAAAGAYAFAAAVRPGATGVYRVTVRYRYLRNDGSPQIDAVVADTAVAIR